MRLIRQGVGSISWLVVFPCPPVFPTDRFGDGGHEAEHFLGGGAGGFTCGGENFASFDVHQPGGEGGLVLDAGDAADDHVAGGQEAFHLDQAFSIGAILLAAAIAKGTA